MNPIIIISLIVAVFVIGIIAVLIVKNKSNLKSVPTNKGPKSTGIDISKTKRLRVGDGLANELLAMDFGSDITASVMDVLAADKEAKLTNVLFDLLPPPNPEPAGLHFVTFVGVNGVGKTTTLGKIANLRAKSGHRVVLGAADTFRAAAGEQLTVWGQRALANAVKGGTVEVVTSEKEGADPASVAFAAAAKAVEIGADDLFIDTAGRQQTNKNLMDELQKIARSSAKALKPLGETGVTSDTYLVLDATSGQTAFEQAKVFKEVVDITGVVITKLDGSAKGGFVFRVAEALKVPVVYIGTGEGVDDIEVFDSKKFVDSLV